MTHIAFHGAPNIEVLAIIYFIKSLHDRELARQLNATYDSNSKFNSIRKGHKNCWESKSGTKYSSDNYTANNHTVGTRNFDRRQRHDSHNSDRRQRHDSHNFAIDRSPTGVKFSIDNSLFSAWQFHYTGYNLLQFVTTIGIAYYKG